MGELSKRLINHIKNNPQKVIISTGRSLNLNGNFLTYYKKRVYGNIGLNYRIGRNESNDGLKIKPPSSGVVESFFDKHVRGFETIESFLTKQFDRIEKNGEQPLRDILTFLENDGRLTINLMDDGGETLFRPNADGSFTINLGISKKSGVKLKSQNELQVPHYGISHRVSIPTSNGISPIEAVFIQERDDPFHIAIGHEMNHLEHREDGSNTGGLRTDFRENEESKEKEDSSRVNNKSVWPNPEEHRNVFGLADPGSELNARMEAGLHLRYPYDTDEPFLEPVKTVLRNAVKSERHIEGTTLPPYL